MDFLLHPATWLLALDWGIRIVALAWIPVRSAPAAARSWLLLVGFLPLLGLPLYLAFGHPWLSRERRERQANASRVIAERQQPLARLRWTPHDDSIADDIARLCERTGDFMPMGGNAITLEDDYAASLQALLADIAAARFEVHLLYYLMFEDAVGDAVADALADAARRALPPAAGRRRRQARLARLCPAPARGGGGGAGDARRRPGLAAQRAHGPA